MDLQSGGGEAAAEGQEEVGHAPGDAGVQQPADRLAAAAAVVAAKNPDKIVILAKNSNNAPVLKTTQFAASASQPFAKVIQHIQKKIRLSAAHKDAVVHLFINQSFSPSPDEQVGDLYKCFQTDGKLVIHYALMEAWG